VFKDVDVDSITLQICLYLCGFENFNTHEKSYCFTTEKYPEKCLGITTYDHVYCCLVERTF